MIAEVSTSFCQQVQLQESAPLSRGAHGSVRVPARLPTEKSPTTCFLSCACVTLLLHLCPSRLSCLVPLNIQRAANGGGEEEGKASNLEKREQRWRDETKSLPFLSFLLFWYLLVKSFQHI